MKARILKVSICVYLYVGLVLLATAGAYAQAVRKNNGLALQGFQIGMGPTQRQIVQEKNGLDFTCSKNDQGTHCDHAIFGEDGVPKGTLSLTINKQYGTVAYV